MNSIVDEEKRKHAMKRDEIFNFSISISSRIDIYFEILRESRERVKRESKER
jgi:hypothetical protein